ncbi:MAG: threonine/serine dehydratase [Alphaproteobacteria bacterium]
MTPTGPNAAADLPDPNIGDIEGAARRIAPAAVRTPLVESPLLNARAGGRILIKAEMLQRTGSFKFRGAYNVVSQIDPERRRRGVTAFSSGNHAQGVAAAAQQHGIPATMVMPADAPAIKRRNTEFYGAKVITYDRDKDDRQAIAEGVVAETGAVLVPPYDHPWIMAGQGTVGLEIAEQAAALEVQPDAVLAPCGGGGLIAGIAIAVSDRLPGCDVFAVEPAAYDDTARSLASGKRLAVTAGGHSFCDALLAPMPGERTFGVNARLLAGGLRVSDDTVAEAMLALFEDTKLVVEPGGAVALAAVLSGAYPLNGRTVVVVCSGGNVDPATFCRALCSGGRT